MAVEQSGAETSPAAADEAPQAAAASPDAQDQTPEATTAPDIDEVKRQFREALDRKRNAHATTNADGTQDTGKVHGSHGPATSRRSFRRKSGG
jgi:2,4-dienoyl-CoA reductase-like NADH-dependent reductase (Old Yellow Enzyme family)